jgi:hypothetical protein
MVSWRSYRDQWLSEALAEYSAMLFIEATMPKSGYFDEILGVYTAEQLGSLKGAMSRFARPWLSMDMRRSEVRDQIGPIGVGYRASTARVPYGYQLQVYDKGALVIHMLRSLLRFSTGSDDVFRSILKDFLGTYAGRAASTRDFADVVSRHVGGDWTWFFDQWVDDTTVPEFQWEAEVPSAPGADGRYLVTFHVVTEGVDAGFTIPLPVEVDYGQGRRSYVVLPVTRPDQVFDVPLSAHPESFDVNPAYGVLARVKKM